MPESDNNFSFKNLHKTVKRPININNLKDNKKERKKNVKGIATTFANTPKPKFKTTTATITTK